MEVDEHGVLTDAELARIWVASGEEKKGIRSWLRAAAQGQHEYDVAVITETPVPNPYRGKEKFDNELSALFEQGIETARFQFIAALKGQWRVAANG